MRLVGYGCSITNWKTKSTPTWDDVMETLSGDNDDLPLYVPEVNAQSRQGADASSTFSMVEVQNLVNPMLTI
ncbi:hypothetical protein Patl1_15394 [Pistacia atlantica]|uniref:Uncharacterized protein n=1 Tax=Pistacia atlantica TaxID=434234 RepID=A0ACC1B6W7_9ROSI|nr:hypothetical protein Patl1_15394 [Pistacia atlantica]